jgi:hypothetical protein
MIAKRPGGAERTGRQEEEKERWRDRETDKLDGQTVAAASAWY